MKQVSVNLVNAFTNNGSGGNGAGVVLAADALNDKQKLKVAQAVGLSETAFICRDDEADFAVSFFTPTAEVDFCGHATVAAFATLHQQGIITAGRYIQRTKAGLLPVTVAANGHITMTQKQPEYLGEVSKEIIATFTGLQPEVLALASLPVEVISTGLPDIIVPVPAGYLDKISINEALLSAYCKKYNVIGLHAFELTNDQSGLSASCRNFAPLCGISEESATGSASGALACYLVKHLYPTQHKTFMFEQGRAMASSSLITATIECNQSTITRVQVGGFAQASGSRQVVLE